MTAFPLYSLSGVPNLLRFLASDKHREDLIRVRLVQIEESRLALGAGSVPRADDAAADGRGLADVDSIDS